MALILVSANCFAVPYNECFVKASNVYKIPKELLIAIASVESSYNSDAINYNKNRSYDLGVMQINSSWFNRLEKLGITEHALNDPCQNIMVGAWILAKNISTYGFTWIAIQHYNGSDTQLKYASKIYLKLKTLYPELANNSVVFLSNYKFDKEDSNVSISRKIKSQFLYVK